MKAFLFIILMHLFPISVIAQRQHVIEPAILEVRYDCWQAEHDDSYILRVGKTANQFFSFFQNRTDSLDFTSEVTRKIALQEFLEANDRSSDRSKRLKASTISRELLYQDLSTGKLSLYSNFASAYNTYEEGIPTQEWSINTDSVETIMGMDFIKFTAVSIRTEGLSPVTFYNWAGSKYYKMDRAKFLKYKNRPRTIPYTGKVVQAKPYIELE